MDFETESRLWDAEVDREAARLVRDGVAPWEAKIRAGEIVASLRRNKPRTPAPSAPHGEGEADG